MARTYVAAVAAGIALAGLHAVPAQADQSLASALYGLGFSFSGSGCTNTSSTGPSSVYADGGRSGQWVTKNATRTNTVVAADPADSTTTTAVVKSQTRRVVKGGQATSLESKGTLSATVAGPEASACTADTEASAQLVAYYQTSYPTWIVTSITNKSNQPVTYMDVNYDITASIPNQNQMLGANASRTSTTLVRGGTTGYQALQLGVDASTGGPVSIKTTYTASIKLFRVGEAVGGPTGSGKAYAVPATYIACSNKSLTVPFTGKAGALKSAVFTVNGKKKAAVTGPFGKGLAVSLAGLNPTAKSTVKGTLTLKTGKKVTVSRSYMPCA